VPCDAGPTASQEQCCAAIRPQVKREIWTREGSPLASVSSCFLSRPWRNYCVVYLTSWSLCGANPTLIEQGNDTQNDMVGNSVCVTGTATMNSNKSQLAVLFSASCHSILLFIAFIAFIQRTSVFWRTGAFEFLHACFLSPEDRNRRNVVPLQWLLLYRTFLCGQDRGRNSFPSFPRKMSCGSAEESGGERLRTPLKPLTKDGCETSFH